MNEKKIIFMQEGAVTQTIVRMYSIKALMRYGYNVEIWSLRFLRTLWNSYPDEIEWDNYVKIDSLTDFKEKLHCNDKHTALILTSIADYYKNRKIYSYLHSKKYPYIFLNPYGSILERSNKSLMERMQLAFSSNVFQKIIPEIQKLYYNKFYKPARHINFNQHIVSCMVPRTAAINSNDYETYLSLETEDVREINEKYILFIDIAFPIHPDIPYFYGVPIGEKQRYLTVMNYFFDILEKKYNMPIVVALHPKCTYTDLDYGGRRTIKYKTGQLIKDAEMVLTQGSTSTTLAVIYNKPTLFFYTQYMSDYVPKAVRKINWYAESLGKDFVKIDNIDISSLEITPFEENKREKCIYTYMTTKENEKTSNDEIVISLCKDFFDKKEKGLSTPFDV